MTDIPDDVVERVARELFKKNPAWSDFFDFVDVDEHKNTCLEMARAAGRIFVEWERERAVKAFTEAAKEKGEWPNVIDYYTAAIRARGE